MGGSDRFLQLAAVCSSVTNDPTGLVTVRTAMAPIDSPRRYIKYAATAPATIVPQNNAFFITAPLRAHAFQEHVLAILGCKSGLRSAASREKMLAALQCAPGPIYGAIIKLRRRDFSPAGTAESIPRVSAVPPGLFISQRPTQDSVLRTASWAKFRTPLSGLDNPSSHTPSKAQIFV